MNIYDVTNLKAQYIKPETNLTVWAKTNKPIALCNASLYSGVSTKKRPSGPPVGTIFESGQCVSNQGNGYGFGIIDGKIVFGKPWDCSWSNYLTGYTTCVLNGAYVAPTFNDQYVFNKKLARIAIGHTKDNRVVIVTDDSVDLQTFAMHAIERGIDTLVNLDGGASRHLVYNSKTIYSSARVPYNAIAFFNNGQGSVDKSNGSFMGKYIDVSVHQGIIDWDKVKKDGNVDGVIIRAGYGKNNIDPQFKRNVSECNRLHIPCGAYWFSYAANVTEASNEATYLLAAVKPYRMDLPLAYDFEYGSVDNAKSRGVSITKSLASSFAKAFCSVIETAGYWALNYANPDFLNRYFDSTVTARYGLWLAQWPSIVDLSKPPRACAIWQWGVSSIPGITGDVDTNASYTDFPTVIAQEKMNHLDEHPIPAQEPIDKPQSQTSNEPAQSGNWYDSAMKFMSDKGWMNDGRPNDPLTRAEFATVMQRIYSK